MRGRSRNSGFTLIELLITLAVLAIILAFGVPSFRTLIENNGVTTQANTFLSAINLARAEAIKRGAQVSLIAESGGFSDGYCVAAGVYLDCDAAEVANAVIRTFEVSGAVSLDDKGLKLVSFDGRGFRLVPGSGFTVQFEFQPQSCTTGDSRLRQLDISLAGRASITEGACT